MNKITIEREVVERALEAMSYADACLKKQLTTKTKHEHAQDMLLSAGSALRQALEQPNEFHPDWDQIKPFNDRIAELEKVAKQALEALEARGVCMFTDDTVVDDAITALRQALSDSVEQPTQQQEPVAWRYKIVDCFGRPVWTLKTPKTDTRVLESQPLYANPQTIDKSAAIRIATALGWEPKKEWVGLTDEEKAELDAEYGDDTLAHLDAIAAKLKEKNNG